MTFPCSESVVPLCMSMDFVPDEKLKIHLEILPIPLFLWFYVNHHFVILSDGESIWIVDGYGISIANPVTQTRCL